MNGVEFYTEKTISTFIDEKKAREIAENPWKAKRISIKSIFLFEISRFCIWRFTESALIIRETEGEYNDS